MYVKKLSTEIEVVSALRMYSKVATKKLPTLITLNMCSEEYYEKNLKNWVQLILNEQLSYGAYEISSNRLLGIQIAVDLFCDLTEELKNKQFDLVKDRDDLICIDAFNQLIKEGVLKEVKNKYLFLVMAAKDESFGSGVIPKIMESLYKDVWERGFESFYIEATTPGAQHMWAKTKPEFVRKVPLNDFEYQGRKLYEGVDFKKFGFSDEKASFHFVLKNIRDYKFRIENFASAKL